MERETAKSLVSIICILSLLSNYLYTTKLLDLSTYFSSSYHRLDHLSLSLPEENTNDTISSNNNNNTSSSSSSSVNSHHNSFLKNDTQNNNNNYYYNNNNLQCSFSSSSSVVDHNDTLPPPPPQIPSFILVGAQKAGTSALYYLLEKLPDIEPSLAFETHFFDQREPIFKQDKIKRRKNNNNNDNNNNNAASLQLLHLTEQEICQAREHYLQFWDNNGILPAGYLGFEKTPVYLCKPEIPALIHQVVPWVKIVVMLRNPVDRAYSGYRMMRERVTNESEIGSFEQLVNLQVKLARDYGLSKAPLLRHYITGSNENNNNTNETLPPPEKLFALPDDDDDDNNNNNKPLQPSLDMSYDRLLFRGMYARQIVNWLQYFTLHVNIKIIRYEVFAETPSEVLNDILTFVGAKHPHKLSTDVLQSAYRPTRGIKRNYTQPMLPSTREYLERFYEPYNQELVELLGEEWRDVWKKT